MTTSRFIQTVIIYLSFISMLTSQSFIGAGNDVGIIVSSSSEEGNGLAQNTVNGKGMDARLFEASRFLSQAGFGASKEDIESLALDLDFEAWVNNQYNLPISLYSTKLDEIWAEVVQGKLDSGVPEEDIYGPEAVHFNYVWWQNVMDGEDQLRQKTVNTLSEIIVVSVHSQIWGFAEGLASFNDIFANHAFGNYKDIMQEVSLHPVMGYYLSHLDNPKENIEENIHPDENYAREIMQLFTIGLYELNLDGTRKKDADGLDIPTYNNDDVKELAKVFTGLGGGGIEDYVDWTTEPYFGLGFWGVDKTVPMLMYPDFHETSEKVLLGTDTIPADQDGMLDIEQTVDFLFNHDNVGPFLAQRFIQRFIKSNPSKEYVARVATVFNDNGEGVRGDMKAFISAILLDSEARDCAPMQNDFSARLRVPISKYTQVARAVDLDSPLGRYWNHGYSYFQATWHHPMWAPNVFNFYLPDYSPIGLLSDNNIFAPEFQLHNTQLATSYINEIADWTLYNNFMYSWETQYGDPQIKLDRTHLKILAEEPEKLLNELDILFTHGQLTDETRTYIRTALEGLIYNDIMYDRVNMALSLLLISADYNIMR